MALANSDQDKLTVLRFLRSGVHPTAIAELLGVDPRTVTDMIKREGYKPTWIQPPRQNLSEDLKDQALALADTSTLGGATARLAAAPTHEARVLMIQELARHVQNSAVEE